MKLALSKETLSELTPDELAGVVAGNIPTWYSGCITTIYPSVGEPDCFGR